MRLVSGGYLLGIPIWRGDWLPAHLVPARVLSASSCLTDHFPGYDLYGGAGESDEVVVARYPYQFASTNDLKELREFIVCMTREEKLEYPNAFISTQAAREYARHSKSQDNGLVLFGVSTTEEHAEALHQFEPDASSIVAVLRRKMLPEPGEVLGWEVLGNDYGSFHSWFCNGIEKAAEGWNIRPNVHGFLDSLKDAERVAEYCNGPEQPAEPGYWAPWRITRYPL